MNHSARPYQEKLISDIRIAATKYKRILVAAPTGSGKSFIFSQLTSTAFERGYRIWVVVPLTELLDQTKAHFRKWRIPHGMIAAGRKESIAFNVHIVSKQTLERRWDKIKNWADIIIIDECHVNYDFQIDLLNHMPESTILLGFTATYERMDGRPLNKIYQVVVKTESIKSLIEMGYLSKFKYFAPPIPELKGIKKSGTDYDATELDLLYKRKAIYGKAITHYKETGGKKSLVYCRNVKNADYMATMFCEAGYKFANLDGTMSKAKRREIIPALADGRLDGITSVNLIAYGFDCPGVENIIMLRPTRSRALFMQMIGRGLRPADDKEYCTIYDHAGNAFEHLDFEYNSNIIDAISNIEYNFEGKKKKKKNNEIDVLLKQCPKCYHFYEGLKCDYCGHIKKKMNPKAIQVIDGQLIEINKNIKIQDRPYEERKEYHDRIAFIKELYAKDEDEKQKAVEELCKVAEELGRAVMWVYHELNTLKAAVNIPLLMSISKVKGYKSGWVFMKRKELYGRK